MSAAEATSSRPAHVPASAVFDFDIHHDEALLRDPHERVRELIQTAPPLFWTPHNGGQWIAINYDDAFTVLRDPAVFSSSPMSEEQMVAMKARMPPGAPRIPALTPILMDPPLHTKFRAPLQRAFSPKAMMALRGEIDALANSLIDEVIAQGGCDFVPTITEQMPVRVFLKMMGLPVERLTEFRALVREVFAPTTDPMEQGRRIRGIGDAMMGVILERRAEPNDDLISQLWAMEIDGEPMSLELMEDYATLLFLAGLDTVINGMSFGIRHLATHRDEQDHLRANPQLIVDAAEEMLRRYTFTVGMRRVVSDTELRGQSIKAGETIIVYLPASGLDPKQFEAPEQFDAEREHKVHMAFGAGPHRCLGSHLARIELQSLYEAVLKRLPAFRLDPAKPVVFHAGMMLAIASLPLRWD